MRLQKAVAKLGKILRKDKLKRPEEKKAKKLIAELKSKRSKIKAQLKKTPKGDKEERSALKKKLSLGT